jgi:hypothetical protein
MNTSGIFGAIEREIATSMGTENFLPFCEDNDWK